MDRKDNFNDINMDIDGFGDNGCSIEPPYDGDLECAEESFSAADTCAEEPLFDHEAAHCALEPPFDDEGATCAEEPLFDIEAAPCAKEPLFDEDWINPVKKYIGLEPGTIAQNVFTKFLKDSSTKESKKGSQG